MEFDALVVREDVRVTAWGRLVRNEHGDWFEPPIPVGLSRSGNRRVRAVWHGAVRIVGADFGDLRDRFERDRAVEAFARLSGIWSGDRLRADQQAAEAFPPDRISPLVTPPCPPPAGGWPSVVWGGGTRTWTLTLAI